MTPALTRQERKAQTRALILATARKLFVECGFLATATADIAAAAKVSHGSIFAHFATRDDLIAAVVSEWGRRTATEVRRLAVDQSNVRAALAAHLEALAPHEAFYARLVVESPHLPRHARRALVEIQSVIASQLESAMARDVAAGAVKPMPLDLAFNTWLGLVHHYLVNRDLFAPRGSVIERWGPRLLDHYVALITWRTR